MLDSAVLRARRALWRPRSLRLVLRAKTITDDPMRVAAAAHLVRRKTAEGPKRPRGEGLRAMPGDRAARSIPRRPVTPEKIRPSAATLAQVLTQVEWEGVRGQAEEPAAWSQRVARRGCRCRVPEPAA